MEKEDTYDFLLRSLIPRIEEKTKLPDNLRWKRGKKKEKEDETEYASKKLVWECIHKAHRDVLTGRRNVEDYIKLSERGLNSEALELYGLITNKTVRITSYDLIKGLMGDRKHRIGPTQKLVNMTLKYMFIMQLYGVLNVYNINEEDCDCPLDSIVLGSLGREGCKWTKDFANNKTENGYEVYTTIQREISEIQSGKSKLSYDFEKWQSW